MEPVIVSAPLWPAFNKLSQTVLGRSVTASVDRRRMTLTTSLECIILALAEFREANSKVSIRDAGSLLRHCSVTFFATMTDQTALELLIHSKIDIVDCDDSMCYLLSANLEVWKQTVVNLAVPSQTRVMKQLAGTILAAFDRLGLSGLFDDYRRSTGTELVLVEK